MDGCEVQALSTCYAPSCDAAVDMLMLIVVASSRRLVVCPARVDTGAQVESDK